MNAKKQNPQRREAADRRRFENAIRDTLSPEAVAAVIALLQPASNYRKDDPDNRRAIDQVDRFREMLLELIGVEGFNTLIEEIGM
jgi:hypothetical protein